MIKILWKLITMNNKTKNSKIKNPYIERAIISLFQNLVVLALGFKI